MKEVCLGLGTRCGQGVLPVLNETKVGFQVWRGIRKNWEKIRTAWRLKDGEVINF